MGRVKCVFGGTERAAQREHIYIYIHIYVYITSVSGLLILLFDWRVCKAIKLETVLLGRNSFMNETEAEYLSESPFAKTFLLICSLSVMLV
jgi:hypothetical protein